MSEENDTLDCYAISLLVWIDELVTHSTLGTVQGYEGYMTSKSSNL